MAEARGSSSESFELPLASITRIIKSAMTENAQMSRESKVAFSKAASIFILYLTHTCLELAKKEKKSTITANYVLKALEEMEFDEFVGPLTDMIEAFKEEKKSKLIKKPKKQTNPAKEDSATLPVPQDDDDDDDAMMNADAEDYPAADDAIVDHEDADEDVED